MSVQEGLVIYGVNNIFTVRSTKSETAGDYLCRLKGKVLKQDEDAYNPLAPGDMVDFLPDETSPQQGLITGRRERRNAFIRWNRKREAPQTVAANLDLIACVASTGVPPFRPRFIDRVLVAAGETPSLIIVNKSDLSPDERVFQRIGAYEKMGYPVVRCSAKTEEGMEKLAEILRNKRTVFIGQSGVGKSSLLNRLLPQEDLEVGEVSAKYERGRHTTKNGRLYFSPKGEFIDTPGIRQIELSGIAAEKLDEFFLDFRPFLGSCGFSTCTHRQEPDCRIKQALEREIHPDRYESYLRLYKELEGRRQNG